MATIDHILIPTDFSDSAEKAYKLAQKLAEAYDGKIDLIHVIPRAVYMDEQLRSKVNLPDPRENLYPHLFNEAELKLNAVMKRFIPQQNRGEYFVKVDRKPSDVIADHASNGNYSLIIMSAKGKDESGMFRGSTTEQVVRKSMVPVMTVDDQLDIDAVNNILVPTDGSLLSMAAIPAAIKLANTLGSSIILLYVNEMYGLITNHFSTKTHMSKDKEIIEHLVNRLKEFSHEIDGQKYQLSEGSSRSGKRIIAEINGKKVTVPVRFEITTGFSAHHEITQFANKSADFVVMTTHGRSGLAHLVMGSNAEKVALNVEKPILTIRPDSKLFNHN